MEAGIGPQTLPQRLKLQERRDNIPHYPSADMPKKSVPVHAGIGERGFPGGPVAKNPPANAGDVHSIPGLGRSLMLQSN